MHLSVHAARALRDALSAWLDAAADSDRSEQ
jgi:hypothetical protein